MKTGIKLRYILIAVLLAAILALSALAFVACGGDEEDDKGGGGGGGETEYSYVVKESENEFTDYTAQQIADIGYEGWCAKADSVGIAYEFNGQYTEAFGIQLNPTYFDAYLYKDGSVYATYNADYVASKRASNGGGDGHCDREAFLGYWYNESDTGEPGIHIQWLCYMDYVSGHICNYDKTSSALPSSGTGFEFQAAASLAHNGNSRTCFIYGNTFSPYKKDTLKVNVSEAPKTIMGCGEVQSPELSITCERENGQTVDVPSYLFDYSFDKDGNVTIDYPILGLKDTTSYKLQVTPVEYDTQIMYDGAFRDVTIKRDSSDTAVLIDGEKTARFEYDIEYYRNIFTVGALVADDEDTTMTADEFAKYTTKYYFMGQSVIRSVGGNDVIEIDSLPDGGVINDETLEEGYVLTPEIAHYAMPDSFADYAASCHYEPSKGPGVFSEDFEIIRFHNFVCLRFVVTTNGEWVANKAAIKSFDEETGALTIESITKYGNNLSTRTTSDDYVLTEPETVGGTGICIVADADVEAAATAIRAVHPEIIPEFPAA